MATNQSDNLRPCPFCGKEAKYNSKESERINCSNASCYQSEEWREYGHHINEWNTRPIEDALKERIDGMCREFDVMRAERDELQTRLGETNKLIEEWGNHIHYLEANLDIAVEALKYYAKLEMREIGILHNVAEEALKKLEE